MERSPCHYSAAEMNDQRENYSELNVVKDPRRRQMKGRTLSSISVTQQEISHVELHIENTS